MKTTTTNFWAGVIVGAGIVKFGPKWYRQVKKVLGIESPTAHSLEKTKEGLNAIDYVNDGRMFSVSRTAADKTRLSELIHSENYTIENEDEEAPDNVVTFKQSEYITYEMPENDSEINPGGESEDSNPTADS